MPVEWSDLLNLSAEEASSSVDSEQNIEKKRVGVFKRLRENLSKTRSALREEIQSTLFEGSIDDETWERLEEVLIQADLGVRVTAQVVGRLEGEAKAESITDGEVLTEKLCELLTEVADSDSGRLNLGQDGPAVLLVVGVNGTGKTTSIGKLAWRLKRDFGLNVLLGAADTFRAAAREQLELWAERAECQIVTGAAGTDPASVAYEAVLEGKNCSADVIIIDTAGRLHNKEDLMAELGKVSRVVKKVLPDAPHETLLVIDATTGQNGLAQAKSFSQTVPLSGVVLTKLDGTAKGGIALSVSSELGVPVKLVGFGEKVEDLRPFDAKQFARALLGS